MVAFCHKPTSDHLIDSISPCSSKTACISGLVVPRGTSLTIMVLFFWLSSSGVVVVVVMLCVVARTWALLVLSCEVKDALKVSLYLLGATTL